MKTVQELQESGMGWINSGILESIQIDARTALLDRIKALELELERAKADRNAEGVRQRAEYLPKLTQAHAALKLAGEALAKWKAYNQADVPTNSLGQEAQGEEFTDAWFDMETALAAIKACGVE